MPDFEPRGTAPLLRAGLIACGFTALCGFLLAAADRANLAARPAAVSIALFAAVILAIGFPRQSCYAVFALIPFFGNFPGGRFMELLNVLVAASSVGLGIRSLRVRAPRRLGTVWWAAGFSVLSAVLALAPTAGGVLLRLREINSLPLSVVECLTAREADPLYSVASVVFLGLAVVWGTSICSAGFGERFAAHSLRAIAAGFAASVSLAVLDFHGLIHIRRDYLLRIDPRAVSFEGFQSVFWNPGWFAWYFTMAFGAVLGLLWTEKRVARGAVAAGLAISYVYFLKSSQRGGFVALHVVLLAFAVAVVRGRRRAAPRARTVAVAVFLGAALAVKPHRPVKRPPRPHTGIQRLIAEKDDPVRRGLARVAIEMFRAKPILGIGEGAFLWKYREYAPAATVDAIGEWADAHDTWLQVLATRGLVGLAAFLFLALAAAGRVLRAVRSPDERSRGVGLGAAFSLAAFAAFSVVQSMFYLQSIQVFFWGLLAIVSLVTAEPMEDRLASKGRAMAAAAAVIAAALLPLDSFLKAAELLGRSPRQPRGFSASGRWPPTGDPMRWSSAKGTLCLTPTAPVAQFRILSADPRLGWQPATVSLAENGRLLDRFEMSAPSIERSYALLEAPRRGSEAAPGEFGACDPSLRQVRLEVAVRPTFSPLSLRSGDDPRHLGVAVLRPVYGDAGPEFESGFGPWERDGSVEFRWTAARASRALSLPEGSNTIVVPVRAANPDLREKPLQIEIWWNAVRRLSTAISDGNWRRLAVAVPAGGTGIVTIQVSRVWQPRAGSVGGDHRYLGIEAGKIEVSRAASGKEEAP